MKKRSVLLAMLLLASFILCSCSSSFRGPESSKVDFRESTEKISMTAEEQSGAAEQPAAPTLPVHERTREFLASLGIVDSRIMNMNLEAMKEVTPEFPEMEWNFAEDLYHVFHVNLPLTEIKTDTCVEEGDFVLITFISRGHKSMEQLWVLTSREGTILSVQTELIGKKRGEEGIWLWEKADETDAFPEKPEKIEYRIDRIFKVNREDESVKIFLKNNQFRNIEEMYQSIIQARLQDLYDKNRYIARTDYLHGILSCCEFRLDENEVLAHAEVVGQLPRAIAEVMGIPVEQYWENILYYQTIGAPLDPDFNTAMRLDAEEYIKEQLCMGALAVYKNIDITEQEVEAFCGFSKKDVLEVDWQENCCAVLEDKILYSMEPCLSDTRIYKPETRLVIRDEMQESWAFAQEQLEKEREGKTYLPISVTLSRILNEMNETVSQINIRVCTGKGSEEENKLMQHMPLVDYNGWVSEGQKKGFIQVSLVAEEDEMEAAIALFEKLVGKYEGVEYKRITEEEAVIF